MSLSPGPPEKHYSNSTTPTTTTTKTEMATMVVPPPSSAAVTKRYRPAPAKTFQCRGYGECRMVFSRSEHLARHIRKHTGERPFTCHCGKQFSRLDNLRQHAQTVHADKQEDNEKMMRDLSTLHATMAAASKSRTSRRAPKMESVSIRPGTSTGYEGGDTWHIQTPTSGTPPVSGGGGGPPPNHSFRSFRDQSQSQQQSAPGQSFRDPHAPLSAHSSLNGHALSPTFSLPAVGTSSRPTTAGGTVLPPLSSLVPFSQPNLLFRPRPSTTSSAYPPLFSFRPGTAPATAPGMVQPSLYDYTNDSPFSFHVPASQDSARATDEAGSESRPQSRRLSVMELCNDSDANVQPSLAAASLLAAAGAQQRDREAAAAAASHEVHGTRRL